ncbi:MAG TPA: hypothetical protein VF868_00815 [Bacteroidia bacterium]|jgi:hypothetical protein
MKNHLSLLIMSVISVNCFSQDTIMKHSGNTVLAKIVEISPTEIKYKKFEFQDGPTYVENKSGIRYIRFSNGLKEEFGAAPQAEKSIPISPAPAETDYYDPNAARNQNRTETEIRPIGSKYLYLGRKIGEREMQGILMKTQDREIVNLIQSAKDANKLQYIGFAAIPLGIGALYCLGSAFDPISGQVNQNLLTASGLLLVGAIACPISSGIFKHKRTVNNRKAVELYNQKY